MRIAKRHYDLIRKPSMYRVLLGVPSSGTLTEPAAKASFLASINHQLDRHPSCQSGPNFNRCWAVALNQGMKGIHTHFAMMHADVGVVQDEGAARWIDILVEEMDKHDLDFISVPSAIKDSRGLTSSGIGNPDCRWNPFRRFTVDELEKMPATFTIEQTDHPDKFLLHNTTLCLFDMRRPLWYETTASGSCRCIFNFEEDVLLHKGEWICNQESEDWKFSRDLWKMGARTGLTSRVTIAHEGRVQFPNKGDWGSYKNGDDDTAPQWRKAVTCG